MAPKKHKQFKRKHKNKVPIITKLKSQRKSVNRDIRHRDQVNQYKKLERSHEKKKFEENDECDDSTRTEEVDPLSMLLGTFREKSKLKFGPSQAIDSEDDDEEESVQLTGASKSENEVNISPTNSDEDLNESHDEENTQECSDSRLDENNDDDEEKDDKLSDPYNVHFGADITNSWAVKLAEFPRKLSTVNVYWPNLKKLIFEVLQFNLCDEKQTVLEATNHAKPGAAPNQILNLNWDELFVKSQIQPNILKAAKTYLNFENISLFQKELFAIINNYQDFYFPHRDFTNSEEIRFIYCLHTVNHLLKTRLKVIHHNERLNKKDRLEVPEEFRDQGLVRPKVLILVPFRDSCYRIVNMISDILLYENKGNVINKIRFKEEFTGSELHLPKRSRKPEDFEQLFTGNVDDSFRIGVTFTKKSIKLYADFYSSDLIIASPLGLRMLIGAEGDKDRDFDFLASIEILIMDQTDVFLMQNWDHVIHVLDHMHLQPRETHGTDFSRVRSWAVNGWAKFYRQTLMFSSFNSPELIALFNRKCANYAGAIRTNNSCDVGCISSVLVPMPQVYQKFSTTSITSAIDDRFEYFTQNVLPQMRASMLSGVLLYIPSYFDFVRLRNHMKKEDYSFVQICEYSKESKVARARDMFFHDEARFLLYSERFHYFHRINLKGIRHLVFYQPPTVPHFYAEMCNLMQETNQNKYMQTDGNLSVTVLYCKYDIYSLSAIVKSSRAAQMLTSDKNVHMYTTGS